MSVAAGVTQALASGQIAEYERRQPARAPQVEDYKVPLAQAGITAVTVGIPAGGLLLGLITQPVVGAATGFALTLASTWIFFLRRSLDTLWIVERMKAPRVEEAIQEKTTTSNPTVAYEIIREKENGSWMFKFGEIPPTITEEKMSLIANAILTDKQPLSRRGLQHIVSRDDYNTLYANMKQNDLLFSTGNKNALTGSGRRLLERFL